MSYPPCRYARRWPELWAQLPTDNDRRRLSQNLASGRLDGQEPSRAFVAAFIDRMLGRITREEFLAATTTSHPARAPLPPSHHPTPATPPSLPHPCRHRPPHSEQAGTTAGTQAPRRAPTIEQCVARWCRATATRWLAPEISGDVRSAPRHALLRQCF